MSVADDISVLEIDDWSTPATGYPLKKVGRARITRTMLKPNPYRMEGVRGYDYYKALKPIPVTSLKIGREEAMVDAPINWYGMLDLAAHCKGKVLIGGLGLGLILHGLKDNKEVTEIHVIEKEKDVIDLMCGNIPEDGRVKIINADIKDYIDAIMFGNPDFVKIMMENTIKHQRPEIMKIIEKCKAEDHYDTVVLDIWWGWASKEISRDIFVTRMKAAAHLPGARVMVWGLRDPGINPAVTKASII